VVSDLAGQIRAALAETERLAQSAAALHPDPNHWFTARDLWSMDHFDTADAKHMARWSPHVALEQVAALRESLDDVLAETHLVVEGDSWFTCAVATEEVDGGTCADDDAGDVCNCGRDVRVERRLRMLARAVGVSW
jgi:hypothetical protein